MAARLLKRKPTLAARCADLDEPTLLTRLQTLTPSWTASLKTCEPNRGEVEVRTAGRGVAEKVEVRAAGRGRPGKNGEIWISTFHRGDKEAYGELHICPRH